MLSLIALPEALSSRLQWDARYRALRAAGPERDHYAALLQDIRSALESAFKDGCDVVALVHGRAAMIDRLLIAAWSHFNLSEVSKIALIAVGGYGRGELHPGSDIDLLLLHDAPLSSTETENIVAFITFLWDIGLQIGHNVCSLEECASEAARDITVATNIMEARLLSGQVRLLEKLNLATGPEVLWNSRDFFSVKLAEQKARHHRFGDTAYRLEPNLKESPGGLRDIQMIGWVARRHFGTSKLHKLVSHGFLTEQEYRDLIDGQNYLWRVRFALHMQNGRREDRLVFGHQQALASWLGFSDRGHDRAVEQFMQHYFRNVTELERLNEMLLQHFYEAIVLTDGEHRADDPSEIVPINRRFQARRGFLEITHPEVFRHYPPALLETFLLLAQHPELQGVRASTIRQMRMDRRLINDKFRNDLACRALFMEILRQPRGLTHQLRRMNRYGILAAYLPAFGMIVGRMQYDLFHIYTVDEHTLFVIRNLRRFAIASHEHEQPLCNRIFKHIPKPELLYLAALFHDIAKGRGGDHSELGALEARAFCLHHGMSQYDANLVSWLVRAHLLMSLTAQRQDISDPEVVCRFAVSVGNSMRLDYLYLLTVADIRGTNPQLWNSWKDSLLISLYHATQRMLRRGLDNPPDQDELIGEVQAHAIELLKGRGMDEKTIFEVWSDFDEEYFLRHSADEIAWHSFAIQRLGDDQTQLPLVLVRQETARGSTEIFLYTDEHPNLFALATTAITRLSLNIVDARIITTRSGKTLDTFLVLEDPGNPISCESRLEEIGHTLADAVRYPERGPKPVVRAAPQRLRHFKVDTNIRFSPKTHYNKTVLNITTVDRPGLLSCIGIALTQCGVKVYNAKIATAGEQVDDVFYITDLEGRPITDKKQKSMITHTLRKSLGEQ